MTDKRRMNVAITRPRHFLFLIGNSPTLEKDRVWNNLIESCKVAESEGGYVKLD